MRNNGDIIFMIAVGVVALLMVVLMIILGLEYFHLTGAIVAGVVTFMIEILAYLKWSWIEENLLQPAIFLAVIGFVGYWAWQGVRWLYFAALVPLGQ